MDFKNVKPGDIITFGEYWQDKDLENGKSPIEWIVLKADDDSCMLTSRLALDCMNFHSSKTEITWETSELRIWLNDIFINSAFSDEEKAQILLSFVKEEENSCYHIPSGNDTEDRVYLLSISEAEELFPSNTARACGPTDYAKSRGAYFRSLTGKGYYWLRTAGDRMTDSAHVSYDGSVDYSGFHVNDPTVAVRPVIRVSR